MNKHIQGRAAVLQSANAAPSNHRRKRGRSTITPDDYVAVSPPPNLRAHPVGDCLIWLHELNAGGYGVASFQQGERLAHRQAFIQSRGVAPREGVLHLCHRRSCVQPSHLYDGDARDNSDDRRLRVSENLKWELFERKADIAARVGKYRWPSPGRMEQAPLFVAPVEHECEYTIPAMDRRICAICGSSSKSDDADGLDDSGRQPTNLDRNSGAIEQRSRSYRDFSNGVSIRLDLKTEYSVPLNRAERRRRDREAKKSPFRNRPALLGSHVVKLSQDGHFRGRVDIPEGKLHGPGLIVWTVRPLF